MPFTDDLRNQIIAKLGDKVPNIKPCPVCGQDEKFLLGEGLINVEMVDTTWIMPQGIFAANGQSVASHVALICSNCGNTQFLNIFVLGLAPLLQAHGIRMGDNPMPTGMGPVHSLKRP